MEHTESGHRLYNKSDLSRLHQILSLKELRLSLEEIKSVLTGGQISPLEIVNLQQVQPSERTILQHGDESDQDPGISRSGYDGSPILHGRRHRIFEAIIPLMAYLFKIGISPSSFFKLIESHGKCSVIPNPTTSVSSDSSLIRLRSPGICMVPAAEKS